MTNGRVGQLTHHNSILPKYYDRFSCQPQSGLIEKEKIKIKMMDINNIAICVE